MLEIAEAADKYYSEGVISANKNWGFVSRRTAGAPAIRESISITPTDPKRWVV
jgi:hypothetical protein